MDFLRKLWFSWLKWEDSGLDYTEELWIRYGPPLPYYAVGFVAIFDRKTEVIR